MSRSSTSVAMATCNGGSFIADQLASLAAQSRRPDQLVICDDASEDDTLEKIEVFRAQAPFEIRTEENPQRLGVTANFEKAISLCDGEIILLADQDDVWAPEKVERLVGSLENHPEWGMAFCNGNVMDSELVPLGYDLWQALFFDLQEQNRVRTGEAPHVFMRHVVAAGNTLAFRSSYRSVLLPFPDLPSVHDAWVAFIIACLSGCGILPEPLIRYRLHSDNLIGIHRFGWRDQIRQARRQIEEDAFGQGARFFEMARDRLEGQLPPDLESSIEEKILHSRTRSAMDERFFVRLPAIYTEWRMGRYRRCAYGLKSLAQDLWLR